MASPYTLQESLHPALGALGAYTSNLAQYQGVMTPYRRDPRLDNQRAFGDALTAYMQATPQRERMRLEREQLADTQRRQKILDQRAKTKFDQEQLLFPLQQKLALANLQEGQAEKRLKEIQAKQAKSEQNILDNWTDFVDESFPNNERAKKSFKRMGPSKNSLELVRTALSQGMWEPIPKKDLPEKLKGLAGLVTRNTVTNEVRSPDKHFFDAYLDKNFYKVEGFEEKKRFLDIPQSVIDAGMEEEFVSQYTIMASNDGREPRRYKSNPQDVLKSSQGINALVRGMRDRSYKDNTEYIKAYQDKFIGEDLVTLADQNGNPIQQRMPKPLPPDNIYPTPTIFTGERERIENKWKEYKGNIRIPDSVKAKQHNIRSTADFLRENIALMRASLRKPTGVEVMGPESFVQSSIYGNIFSGLQTLKELGVPTGRDIELVEQQMGNPSVISFTDFVKSGAGIFGTRAEAYLTQLDMLEKTVEQKLNYANKMLGMGVPLDLANASTNDGESTTKFSQYESGDYSAEEFENAVKIK
tara:strand:- start:2010 stop:3593 length:1584 start_codon:yes stop_codon:yes gene_type:complete